MKEFERITGNIRRAVTDYSMIDDGDLVCVGLSGGKDSTVLLSSLVSLSKYYEKKFSIVAVTVDSGFDNMDFSALTEYCSSLGVQHIVEKTDIAKIVFSERKEENPCSLCSRMRRGALTAVCDRIGATKLALGHHFDDAAETVMMNLLNEGRFGCFMPVTKYEKEMISVIRPMIYVKESAISYVTNKLSLPTVISACPQDKDGKRQEIKKLLYMLDKENPGVKHRIFKALCKAEVDGYKDI